ncbi:MAG: hypothetical protein WCJ72_14100 [Chryseobacterium sp.]
MGIVLEVCIEGKCSVNCFDESEGWDSLSSIHQTLKSFSNLFVSELVCKEFWAFDETQPLAPSIVGYNISVRFNGQLTSIYRFTSAVLLLFDMYKIKKTNETLDFVDDGNNS